MVETARRRRFVLARLDPWWCRGGQSNSRSLIKDWLVDEQRSEQRGLNEDNNFPASKRGKRERERKRESGFFFFSSFEGTSSGPSVLGNNEALIDR